MKTIEDALKPLKNADRVKIILPCGTFIQGRKRNILKNLPHNEHGFNVTDTKIQFIPLPLRKNLYPEFIIIVE